MGKLPLVAGLTIFIVSILLGTSLLYGKTYVWTDKKGKTHFTETPPPPGQAMQRQTPNQRSYTYRQPASQKKVNTPKVELYITSWCPYCKKAIEYFESKGIRYKTYDIEKDAKAAARKKKLDKSTGVPFAVINGQYIHGYAPKLYAEALQEK